MRCGVLALAALLAAVLPGSAQEVFPARAVKLVVPFPPGGPSDVLARMLAERLGTEWRQPVIVENRPGGNTAIAAASVAKSSPDGYTLLAAMDTTLVMNTVLKSNAGYDPMSDFAFIGLTSENPVLLLVPANGPSSIEELVRKSKLGGAKTNFGAGIVTNRLAGAVFAKSVGIEAQLIPYSGSSQVLQALLTGTVDFAVDGPATNVALVKEGKLRALAKFSDTPLLALPEVLPLSNLMNGPVDEFVTWTALVAPAGTPAAIVETIQRKVREIYRDEQFVERARSAGIAVKVSTAAELEARIKTETAKWTRIVSTSGVQLDQ